MYSTCNTFDRIWHMGQLADSVTIVIFPNLLIEHAHFSYVKRKKRMYWCWSNKHGGSLSSAY